jgi:hypothetical protein
MPLKAEAVISVVVEVLQVRRMVAKAMVVVVVEIIEDGDAIKQPLINHPPSGTQ